MPYRYSERTIPESNYILADNKIGIIIFIGEDMTLYIFPINTYNLRKGEIVIKEITLPSYKYEYFPYPDELDDIREFRNTINRYKNHGYPYIDIFIFEMS